MKRLLSLFLCICLCAGLFAGMTLPASAEGLTMEQLQQITVDTALAYCYKGGAVQYGSYFIGAGHRYQGAIVRQTNNRTPEDASMDLPIYQVCSAMPHDVYFSMFGKHVVNNDTSTPESRLSRAGIDMMQFSGAEDPRLNEVTAVQNTTAQYCYQGQKAAEAAKAQGKNINTMTQEEKTALGFPQVVRYYGFEEGLPQCPELSSDDVIALFDSLQPGDIVVATTGYDDDSSDSGHAMMFVGDIDGDNVGEIIHSSGSKYNRGDRKRVAGDDSTKGQVDGITEENLQNPTVVGSTYLTGYDLIEPPISEWSLNRNTAQPCADPLFGDGMNYAGNMASAMFGRNGGGTVRVDDWTSWLGPWCSMTATGPAKRQDGVYQFNKGDNCGWGYPGNRSEAGINNGWGFMCRQFTVLRPLADSRFTANVSNTALGRLALRDLMVTKTADKSVYEDVTAGSTLTYTIELDNPTYNLNGASGDRTVRVEEPLPAGVTDAIATAGGVVSGGKVVWDNVTVAEGQVVRLSYTVTVPALALGAKFTSPAGKVVAIPDETAYLSTSELYHCIGGKHIQNTAGLLALKDGGIAAGAGTDILKNAYATLGISVELPQAERILTAITEQETLPYESASYRSKLRMADPATLTGSEKLLRQMVVRDYVGGKSLMTYDENGIKTPMTRLRNFKEEYLVPGDLLLYADLDTTCNVTGTEVYLYLGREDGHTYYAHYNKSNACEILDAPLKDVQSLANGGLRYLYSKVLTPAFLKGFFCLLRPSQAVNDLNTASLDTRLPDVTMQIGTGAVQNFYDSTASALEQALDAATGTTSSNVANITLLTDQTLTRGTSYPDLYASLELNGHTITSPALSETAGTYLQFSNGDITVKNGTVYGAGAGLYFSGKAVAHLDNIVAMAGSTKCSFKISSTTFAGCPLAVASAASLYLKNTVVATGTAVKVIGGASKNGPNVYIEDNVTIAAISGKEIDSIITTASAASGLTVYPRSNILNTTMCGNTAKRDVKITQYTTAAPEAKCGSTYYPTLGDAICDVPAGETITLLKDVDLSDPHELGTPVLNSYPLRFYTPCVLDFDGHTVTDLTSPSGSLRMLVSGCELKNGTILSNGGTAAISAAKECDLTLTNMDVTNQASATLFASNDSTGTFTVSGGRIVSEGSYCVTMKGTCSSNLILKDDVMLHASGVPLNIVDGVTATVYGCIIASDTELEQPNAGGTLIVGEDVTGPTTVTGYTLPDGETALWAQIYKSSVTPPPGPVDPDPPKPPEDFEDNEENFRKAIAETALAYYRKGAGVQYDSIAMTYIIKHQGCGLCRISSQTPPEYSSADNPLYTVCSDYCYNVFYDAFNYKLTGVANRCVTSIMCAIDKDDPQTVYKWDEVSAKQCTEAGLTRQQALANAETLLQPGDVVVGYRKINSGHAMLYLGDYKGDGTKWFIHAGSGSKIDIVTGKDSVEPGGTLVMCDADKNGPFRPGGHYDLVSESRDICRFIILRPMRALLTDGHLTPAAKARLRYPQIDVDRSASLRKYQTATVGETVTVKVDIKNNSTQPYGYLNITEALPQGGVIRPESISAGGVLTDTGILWEKVKVPAGETKTLTYEVVISGLPGEKLILPGGTVDTLTTRAMSYAIGGKILNADKQAALAGVANMEEEDAAKYVDYAKAKPVGFVNALYKNVLGIELNLPESISDYVTGLLDEVTVLHVNNDGTSNYNSPANASGTLWAPKATLAEPWQSLSKMFLPEHLTGRMVCTEDPTFQGKEVFNATDRVLVFDKANYEPGDIFIGLNGSTKPSLSTADTEALVYVYLGNGKVATVDAESGLVVAPFSDTLELALRQRLLIALRPSLTYADVNTGATLAASGACGTNACFVQGSDGQLLIYGAGDVTSAPWNTAALKGITVTGDVASLPENAFVGASGVTETTLAKTVTTVGANAYNDCTAMTTVNYGGTMDQWNAMTVGEGNLPLRSAANFNYDKCGGHHTWDGGVPKEATATAKGYTTYTCTVCGATEQRNLHYPAGTKVIVTLPNGGEGYFPTLDQTVIAFATDKTICSSINAATITLLENVTINDSGTAMTAEELLKKLQDLGSTLTSAKYGLDSNASYMPIPYMTNFTSGKTTPDGAVIVDLDGHTLTYNGTRNLFQSNKYGLTVKNGTINYTGTNKSHGFYVCGGTAGESTTSNGKKWLPILNVENATVYSTSPAAAIQTYGWYAQVNLRDSTVLGSSKGLVIAKSTTSTYEDKNGNIKPYPSPFSPSFTLSNSTLGGVGADSYTYGANATYPPDPGKWITADVNSRLVYGEKISDKDMLTLPENVAVLDDTFSEYFPGGSAGTKVRHFEEIEVPDPVVAAKVGETEYATQGEAVTAATGSTFTLKSEIPVPTAVAVDDTVDVALSADGTATAAYALAALYDSENNMLAIGSAAVTAGSDMSVTVKTKVAGTAATLRLFFLGSEYQPVCQYITCFPQ